MTTSRTAHKAIVVGAGIVGLSTAFSLQQQGVEVTVIDRTGPAAGASWGNAGWLSPAFTIPLPEPALLKQGRARCSRRRPRWRCRRRPIPRWRGSWRRSHATARRASGRRPCGCTRSSTRTSSIRSSDRSPRG
ncbi:FAD-dependent oxidoreductase [Tsukamurella sp. PLM1]|uniref:FAD-dependent oxidoreductase n=1 Tax=Tsukamurella sp. PLM1 TaxID=2929795 RepID=UPI003530200E